MTLNDLLIAEDFDPQHVLVFRHRPHQPALNKVLPWLAAEKPEVFNAYQQTQGERLERVMSKMSGTGSVASFIGHEPGKAVFVGLYSIGAFEPLTEKQFWKVPAHHELKPFGLTGIDDNSRYEILWFDLACTDAYSSWKGRLIVDGPPPERSWWRRAHRNVMPVHAIVEDSLLDAAMPPWTEMVLGWEDLRVLPRRWRSALAHWRGIYYIFDTSDGTGYVGSAYGETNILGRWEDYADQGHGGNRLLLQRDPENFQFSILQRVSPDLDAADVIRLEISWKQRLHTRAPHGLNDN